MKRFLLLSAIVLAPALVTAHTDQDGDAIKARRAYFTLIGTNMAGLGAMAKGEVAYDAEQAAYFADNLSALASYDTFAHFPEGSSIVEHKGDTRALPEIWSADADIEKNGMRFSMRSMCWSWKRIKA